MKQFRLAHIFEKDIIPTSPDVKKMEVASLIKLGEPDGSNIFSKSSNQHRTGKIYKTPRDTPKAPRRLHPKTPQKRAAKTFKMRGNISSSLEVLNEQENPRCS